MSVTPQDTASGPLPLRVKRFRRPRRNLSIPPLRGLLPLVIGLVLWQVLSHGQSAYYPRPSLWWEGIEHEWQSGALKPVPTKIPDILAADPGPVPLAVPLARNPTTASNPTTPGKPVTN